MQKKQVYNPFLPLNEYIPDSEPHVFGDWYLIKNRDITKRIFTGKDREVVDKFYYDIR